MATTRFLAIVSLAGALRLDSTTLRRRAALSSIAAAPAAAFAKDLSRSVKPRDVGYPVQQVEWAALLEPGQLFVLRMGGTEPRNSSPLVGEKRSGRFVCAGCGSPLFDSAEKFESGTGWPSFAAARAGAVEAIPAGTSGYSAEARCARCGGHLGDVFSDGARFVGTRAAETGQRYCVDGAALVFLSSDSSLSPVVGDGLTARAMRG